MQHDDLQIARSQVIDVEPERTIEVLQCCVQSPRRQSIFGQRLIPSRDQVGFQAALKKAEEALRKNFFGRFADGVGVVFIRYRRQTPRL